MSTTRPPFSSASLKAINAQRYSSIEDQYDPSLLQALTEMYSGFMTPLQSLVLGGWPCSTSDCLVRTWAGSGKIAAFLLPAIQNALLQAPRKGAIAVVIAAATEDFALHIAAVASHLVARLTRPLPVHTAFGGFAKFSQVSKFRTSDPKILVGTPGRLNDYMRESDVRARIECLKTLVINEADTIKKQGFLPDIVTFARDLQPQEGPRQWQCICFSEIITLQIEEQLLDLILKKNYTWISMIAESFPSTLEMVQQYSMVIPKFENTFAALFSLLKEEIATTDRDSKIIVYGSEAKILMLYPEVYQCQIQLEIYELHFRLAEAARIRATENFKSAKSGIMFTTDDIGQMMDYPDVTLILQVGLLADADAYKQRLRQTARCGKAGRAVLLLTQLESFWLDDNRQLPIQPYPASERILNDTSSADQIATVLKAVDEQKKQKAYTGFLGFMKGYLDRIQMNNAELVQMANIFALEGMQCEEVPGMYRKTIKRLGLRGVPGIVIAEPPEPDPDDLWW